MIERSPWKHLVVLVTICLTSLLFAAGTAIAAEGNVLTAEASRADVRTFAKFLEDTHPDPYSAFGGRVAFQLEIAGMLDRVPDDGLSDRELYDMIRAFLGRMGDGHSYVQAPHRPVTREGPRYLPVRFKVAHDEILVIGAKESHATLIGARVRAAAGLDLGELRDAARNVLPKENDFAASALALRLLGSDSQARRMLPDIQARLPVRLLGLDGVETDTVLPYSLTREEWVADDWVVKRWSGIPESTAPIATRVWEGRNAAYLGLRTIMAREAFEIMRASGRTDLGEHLEQFYQRQLHRDMPTEVGEAVLGTPSICQASHAMLSSMRDQGIENLIVDLRGNGGGWSEIMKPLYYMLHGDRFFERDPVRYATRFSEGYLRILGTDLATYNQKRGTRYELGDLKISGGEETGDTAAARTEWLADLEKSSPDCYSLLKSLDGRPLHTPRVYVVTDAETFSAAYDAAYQLWRLGAETVGVPPAQSAHTFVEGTPFKLPASKLEGAISRTAVTYPDLPERKNAFLLDHTVTWDVFRRFQFDLETEILFTLELIQRGASPR